MNTFRFKKFSNTLTYVLTAMTLLIALAITLAVIPDFRWLSVAATFTVLPCFLLLVLIWLTQWTKSAHVQFNHDCLIVDRMLRQPLFLTWNQITSLKASFCSTIHNRMTISFVILRIKYTNSHTLNASVKSKKLNLKLLYPLGDTEITKKMLIDLADRYKIPIEFADAPVAKINHRS